MNADADRMARTSTSDPRPIERAPIDVVRELYRRFIFDEDPFDLLADDVVWEAPILDQPEDAFRGHIGVADFFRRWLGTWDYYKIELESVVEAPDGRIVSFFTEKASGRRSGAQVQLSLLGLWTVRDGKVAHYKGYTDRREGLRAAGLV
jgi:ketosteroid isomerase-like protein